MNKHLSSALLLGACVMASVANAQFYVVKDGKLLFSTESTPDYVTFENPMLCGGVIGEAVDLGLSVKWSSVNVGASSPEDNGNYYAWGETETKDVYSWATYKFMDHETEGKKDSQRGVTKYTFADSYNYGIWYQSGVFVGDGKTTLESADDAAAANWGGKWRMPTAAEWEELSNNCYLVWTSDYNSTGKAGLIIYKAKADEDKGQVVKSGNTPSASYSIADTHIFLPAAQYYLPNGLYNEFVAGAYWSSSLYDYNSYSGRSIAFDSDFFSIFVSGGREDGQPIRPVCPAGE